MLIPGVPSWALAGGALFLLVLAFWWYQERSIRGVKRRSERSTKRTAGWVGAGVVAVFGAIAGLSDVSVQVLGQIGDVVIPSSPDLLAQLGIILVGWLTMNGSLQMRATTFVAVAVGIIILAIAVDN